MPHQHFQRFDIELLQLWKKSVKSDIDTGYGYVPHKVHVQNDLIEFFAGMHSLLWLKFGQHINQRLCVHLTLARFVLTR